MHSDRLTNPLDPIAGEIRKFSKKRTKTETDYASIARLEFEAGFYWEEFEKLGPYIPPENIVACIRDAAKSRKRGKDVTRGVICENAVPLEYDGPRTIQELWDAGGERRPFVDMRSVVVGRARVMRCRPRFNDWVAEALVSFDTGFFELDEFTQILEYAGRYVGLCEYRPRFGRFSVRVLSADADTKELEAAVAG